MNQILLPSLIIGCALLIVPSILLVLGMMAIKVEDMFCKRRASVFFTQPRLGKHKREFIILKLRTYFDDKETLVGKILRVSKIDELPQVWNVIRGEMRFYGPRPMTEADHKKLGTINDDARFEVDPGILGLEQWMSVFSRELQQMLSSALNRLFRRYARRPGYRLFLAAATIAALGMRICGITPLCVRKRLDRLVHTTDPIHAAT